MKISPPHVALTLALTVFTGVITYHLATGEEETAPTLEAEQLAHAVLANAPAVAVPMAPVEPASVPAPTAPEPEAAEAPRVASANPRRSPGAAKPIAPAKREALVKEAEEEAEEEAEAEEDETEEEEEAQVTRAPDREQPAPKPHASTTPTVPGYGEVVGAEAAEGYDEASDVPAGDDAALGVDEQAPDDAHQRPKRRKRTALTTKQKKDIDRLQESWRSLGEALEDLRPVSGR